MSLLSTGDLASLQRTVQQWLTTPCTITRGATTIQTTCDIVPGADYQPLPGSTLLRIPLWKIGFPAGTDVRSGDQVTALGQVYGVSEVQDPRTYEVERVIRAYLMGPVGGPFTGPLQANATVTHKRGGSVVDAARRVHLYWPTVQEQMTAQGALLTPQLYDSPDATWRQGDTLTITALDGFTTLPQIVEYGINGVVYNPGPPPFVVADIAGALS